MADLSNLTDAQLQAIVDYNDAVDSGTLFVSAQKNPTAPEKPVSQDATPGGDLQGVLGGWTDSQLQELANAHPQEEPSTTATGLASAALRGAAPVAGTAGLGALIGGGIGALGGGVGAIPGALIGGEIGAAVPAIGDLGVAGINALFGTNYGGPSEAWQHLLTSIGVPEPKTAAERILQTAVSAGAGAGGIAKGAGAVAKMATSGGKVAKAAEFMAQKPVQQVMSGAAGGVAGQVAQEMGAGPKTQFAAGMLGGVAGAKLAGTTVQNTKSGLQAAVKQAEGFGLHPRTSDVFPPKTGFGRFAGITGESIPVAGTAGGLVKQQESRIAAIQKLADEIGVDHANPAIDRVMSDLAATRGAELKHFVDMKRQVVDALTSTGAGVRPTRSVTAINQWIQKLKGISGEHSPTISRLEGFKHDLLNPQLNVMGIPVNQLKTLEQVEGIRKLIGEMFKDPSLAHLRKGGEAATGPIYKALKEDMEAFILQHGGQAAVKQWKTADGRLSLMAGELKKQSLSSVLKSGAATPEDVQKLLFSAKPSDIRSLYANLDDAGKATARLAIIERAMARSLNKDGIISPEKFITQIQKMAQPIGVFFKGSDLHRVRGLAESLQMLNRAGQFAVMPPTGVQSRIPNILSALLGLSGGASGPSGLAVTAGSVASIGLMARFYESKAVRDILLKLPTVKSEAAKQSLVDSLVREATKFEKENKKEK